MNSQKKCPQCGAELSADAPEGLCPKCLIKGGLAVESEPADQPPVKPTIVIGAEAVEESGTVAQRPEDSRQPQIRNQKSEIKNPLVRYFGDYELLEEIARGGMGVVFKARQVSLNRPVALKMILAGQLASEADVKRFHTEAEAAANLDHPNIVQIYEVGMHEGQHYFSMQLIEGESLAQRISDFGFPILDLDSEKAGGKSAIGHRQSAIASFLAQVARAVHFAHQRGILHRDLKPANILIGAKGEPHVTDFGLAKRLTYDSSLATDHSALTLSGAVMGTPHYMAPEQAQGKVKQLSTGADVYSLGAILYQMLTGRPPFEAETPLEVMRKAIEEEPERPNAVLAPSRREAPLAKSQIENLKSRIDSDLETICLKCLEKDPKRRYGSAEALAEELERWQRGEPITARPVTSGERLVKWAKRKPLVAALGGAVLLALILGIGGIVWQWRQTERARRFQERETYRAKIALAHSHIVQGAPALARGLLAECAPALQHWEWGHLKQVSQAIPIALQGHKAPIQYCLFSPDGKNAATLHQDKQVRVWDALAAREKFRINLALDRFVHELCFSEDSGRLILVVADSYLAATEVVVWDVDQGREIKRYPPEGRAHLVSPNGRRGCGITVPATWSPTVILWEIGTNRRIAEWQEPGEEVKVLGFSPDGQRLLTLSIRPGFSFKIWDAGSGKRLAAINSQSVYFAAVFSPDGKRLLLRCSSGFAEIHETDTGQTVSKLGPVVFRGGYWVKNTADLCVQPDAVFSPNGTYVATLDVDGMVAIWEPETGKRLAVLPNGQGRIAAMTFCPDNRRLLTAGRDHPPTLWEAATGHKLASLPGPTDSIQCLALSPDGKQALAGTVNGLVKLWSVEDEPGTLALVPAHTNAIVTLGRFSHDGQRVLAASRDRPTGITEVKVWDLRGGKEVASFSHTNPVAQAVFSKDGQRVLTLTRLLTNTLAKWEAKVWDLQTGREAL
jgi:serine/threonine protein kinase/WD40 repeat protein